MAARALLLLVAGMVLAGCADDGAGPEPSAGDADDARLPPREVLAATGNNDQCSQVLSGEQVLPFTVHEGYAAIEIEFHASGLGQVGYSVREADGAEVAQRADENPANQPCVHDHVATDPHRVEVAPGEYEFVVRNVGILGWQVVVNEVAGAPAPAA